MVLFGGRSAEHDVSCVTAASVLGAVDRDRYEVVAVGIDRDGNWVRATEAPDRLDPVGPDVDPFDVVHGPQTVVFPLLHGPLGEDGTVQGLLELAGVPYVGCGVLSSALAMDKAMAKEVLARAGVPQARWLALRRRHRRRRASSIVIDRELGWPVFVKPANMGSSVGVSKVDDRLALGDALRLAFGFDEWIVVEEAIVGREVECAVLGDLDPQTSVMGEIVPSHEFYDYDDKYSGEGAELHVPADLPADVALARPRPGPAGVRGPALRRPGPGRSLLRGGRSRSARQRGQHHPGLHPVLHVPPVVGGHRPPLRRAHRPSRRLGPVPAPAERGPNRTGSGLIGCPVHRRPAVGATGRQSR